MITLKTIAHAGYKTQTFDMTPRQTDATRLAHAIGPWLASNPNHRAETSPFMDPKLIPEKSDLITHEGIVSLRETIRATSEPHFMDGLDITRPFLPRFTPIYAVYKTKGFRPAHHLMQIWVAPVNAVLISDNSQITDEEGTQAPNDLKKKILENLPLQAQSHEILHLTEEKKPADECVFNLWPLISSVPSFITSKNVSVRNYGREIIENFSGIMEELTALKNRGGDTAPMPVFISIIATNEHTTPILMIENNKTKN